MNSPSIPARGKLVVIGVVLLVAPAVLLAVTLLVLVLGRNILLSDLSTIRIVELYVTKLVLFALLGVLLYRFVERTIERQLPAVLDDVEREAKERERASEHEDDSDQQGGTSARRDR